MVAVSIVLALAALQETPAAEPAPAAPEAQAVVETPAPPAPEPKRFAPAVEEPAPSRRLADRPEAGPSLGGFLAGSAVVITLLAGAFLLFKRLARNSRFLGTGGPIRVLARKGLGSRHDLFLVEVGRRVLLLGATRERLGTLGEFTDPDEVARLRADPTGRPEGTFREALNEGIRAEEKPFDPPAGGGLAQGKPAPDGVYASISEELAEIGRTVRAWKS